MRIVDFHGNRGHASNDSVIASLRRIREDDDIALDAPERVGAILIENIYRTADGSTGKASAILRAITQWADEAQHTLVLIPAGEISGCKDALVAWYERNGFRRNNDGAMTRQHSI